MIQNFITSIRPIQVLVMAFALVWGGCSNTEQVRSGDTREGMPDQESWGVTITLTDKVVKRALIRSGHLEKYQDRQYIMLDEGVEADFFDKNENHTTYLTALVAEVDEKSNFMVAIGNVVVVSDSGVTLFTDTLSWNNDTEQVFTDDPVMVTTENSDTLYGVGFESNIELNHWKILKPTGVMHEDKDEK